MATRQSRPLINKAWWIRWAWWQKLGAVIAGTCFIFLAIVATLAITFAIFPSLEPKDTSDGAQASTSSSIDPKKIVADVPPTPSKEEIEHMNKGLKAGEDFIANAIRMNVFMKVDSSYGDVTITTDKEFAELTFDQKQKAALWVFEYYAIKSQEVPKAVHFVDGYTNKDVGIFYQGELTLK